MHQVAELKEEAALGLRSTGACQCDSDGRWWSSILCWGCYWWLDQKYQFCAKKETLQFDRGPKGVKTLSLSFLTKFHLPSAKALKVEGFWQCEVTEGGKTLSVISLMFVQAIGSLGWVGERIGMSKSPEISVGHISQRGIFPGWILDSPGEES